MITAPERIAHPRSVRSADLEWEPLGKRGIRRKHHGYGEASGFVTALMDIPAGWHGGGVAHHHHAFEEMFMLKGSSTRGGSHYWHAGGYFSRPSEVAHGHDSNV